MTNDAFIPDLMTQTDLTGALLHPCCWQFLPLDTKHFSDVELDILALFDDLDVALDGWLVHSENYQALNTLLPKFRERVQAIHIDPPYNTDAGPIDYANDYRNSSWLSMTENRLVVAKQLLSESGILCVTIDDYQVHELAKLLDDIFGRVNQLGTVAIRNNPSGVDRRSKASLRATSMRFSTRIQTQRDSPDYPVLKNSWSVSRWKTVNTSIGRAFGKGGGAVTYRSERPKQFYPIEPRPETKDNAHPCVILE